MLQERLAQGVTGQRLTAREDRSLVPSDGQPKLSAHDHPQHAVDAGYGNPLLPGVVSDAVHRPAPVHGFDVLHFQLLPSISEGAVPEELAADIPLLAATHGSGYRIDHNQHEGRA